jgi:prepilin-type N-terminal cleavage/methylation domain-containing protein
MIARPVARTAGFSLVELLTALAIFMIICGVAFEMLTLTMKKYRSDSQLLNTFQEARFGLDQMVRDIDDAGYPPRNQIKSGTTPPLDSYAVTAFAWGGSTYPFGTCSIGGSCPLPNNYDIIIETNIDPKSDNKVEWVRYRLGAVDGTNPTTLYRGVIQKSNNSSQDPQILTDVTLVPYVQNVMNNPPADQLAALQAQYPSMFSGGSIPVFKYLCESTPEPRDCTDPVASTNDPKHVVAVIITLIVEAPTPDTNGRIQVVQLKGQARRINPDY